MKKHVREFVTAEALESQGDTACYKVYVILDTENERSSNPVIIQRPAASRRLFSASASVAP